MFIKRSIRTTATKRISQNSLIVLAIILFLVSFPLAVSGQDSKPIKIGQVVALSGAMAIIFQDYNMGQKVAADEIMKAKGFLGRRVEFIARDDTGNPELNARFCRELKIREEIDWIITGGSSAAGLAATAVAKEYGLSTFMVCGADKITNEEWNPYVFRYRPPCTAESRAAARIVAEEMTKGINNPRIYWISWDYEFGRSAYEPFMARIKELRPDVKIVGEAWPRPGEVDYSPFISHMIAVKPHVVVNAIWGGGVLSLLKQGKERGLWDQSKLIGLAEMMGIDYRKPLGLNMPVGAWGGTYDDPTWPNNEGHKKFYDLYSKFSKKPKGEPPGGFAVAGYNIIHLINKAIEKARSTEGLAMSKAMEGMSMDTYLGPISVRDFDHNVTSGYIWGPTIEEKGLPYRILDPTRIRYISAEKDLPTKEEWLSKRKTLKR